MIHQTPNFECFDLEVTYSKVSSSKYDFSEQKRRKRRGVVTEVGRRARVLEKNLFLNVTSFMQCGRSKKCLGKMVTTLQLVDITHGETISVIF